MTPACYVETARVQAAPVALKTTAQGVEQIARGAGFQNAERMRRAFQRHLGVSVSEYRERFRGSYEPHAPIRDGPDQTAELSNKTAMHKVPCSRNLHDPVPFVSGRTP
jgi:hypothetical protein